MPIWLDKAINTNLGLTFDVDGQYTYLRDNNNSITEIGHIIKNGGCGGRWSRWSWLWSQWS